MGEVLSVKERVEPAIAKAPEIKPFKGGTMQLAEFSNALWRLDAPPECTREMLEDPRYWPTVLSQQPVNSRVRPFDHIHVVGHQGSFFADLLVWRYEPNFPVAVEVLTFKRCPEIKAPTHDDIPAGHSIRFDPQSGLYQGFRDEGDIVLTQPNRERERVRYDLVNHATLR